MFQYNTYIWDLFFGDSLIITNIRPSTNIIIESPKEEVKTVKESKSIPLTRYRSWRDIRSRVEPTLNSSQKKNRNKFLEKQLANTQKNGDKNEPII